MNTKIAVLGAGSWGTAVAIHLAKSGHDVFLWGHHSQHMQDMAAARCNQRYLPDVTFPTSLHLEADLHPCVKNASLCIIAVPSHAFSSVLAKLPQLSTGLTWLTKGLDPATHGLLSQLVAQRFGSSFPIAIVSGPSFAKEVARNLPTALVLAGQDTHYLRLVQHIFHHQNMRVYLSDDVIGVQLCGAVKNVLAIASGISDGLNYGANAKAALITRGLTEMRRLGLCLGARQETFMGLAGLGDLVLTCTDNQSRNRRFGLQLGQGISLEKAERDINQVVEGKNNAAQVCVLASHHGIDMPICYQVNELIQGRITPEQAVKNLMSRPPKEDETF